MIFQILFANLLAKSNSNYFDAKTRWSNLIELIESFSYMIGLTVSKFHDLFDLRSMSLSLTFRFGM